VSDTLDIGEVVARSGIPTSALHVWEREGLIAPVSRTGLRRQYDSSVLDELATIVVSQRSGFTLAEIAGLLNAERFAESGREVLAAKLEELRERRSRLDLAITGLEHALDCPHDTPTDCATFRSILANVLPVER